MTDRYAREPGTRTPTHEQLQAVWGWIASVARVYDRPEIIGAQHAAEWTIGLTDIPPMTGRRLYSARHLVRAPFAPPDIYPVVRQATPDAIVEELNAAAEMAGDHGQERPDRDRAGGVYAWLAWWTGTAELMDFLVPDPEHLPGRRRDPAA